MESDLLKRLDKAFHFRSIQGGFCVSFPSGTYESFRAGIGRLVEEHEASSEIEADWDKIQSAAKKVTRDCHSVYEVLDEVPKLREQVRKLREIVKAYEIAAPKAQAYLAELRAALAEACDGCWFCCKHCVCGPNGTPSPCDIKPNRVCAKCALAETEGGNDAE